MSTSTIAGIRRDRRRRVAAGGRAPQGSPTGIIAPGGRAVKRLGALVAVLALAATAVTVAAAAGAQSPSEVLVSNVALDNRQPVGAAMWNQDLAQDFTTGSNPGGYRLSSVEVSFTTIGAGVAGPTVKLASASAHARDAITLSGPDSLTQNTTQLYTYMAPAGTILDSSTQYWIVVEHRGDDVRLDVTDEAAYSTNTAEDTALAGWSIGDYTWWRSDASTGEFIWGGTVPAGQPSFITIDPPQAFLVRVNGTAAVSGIAYERV